MASQSGIIEEIAGQHGLARVPLFRPGEHDADDQHEVLLDGPTGSFAISESRRGAEWDPSSWAWSAHVPHHLSILGNEISVIRWDASGERFRTTLRDMSHAPDMFYTALRRDRVKHEKDIVQQAMALFRKVRALAQHSGVPDERAVDAYLSVLSSLLNIPELAARPRGNAFILAQDAADLMASLPKDAVEAAVHDFQTERVQDHTLTAWPRIALRHASGPIFQEAHYHLPVAPVPDIFAYVPALQAKRTPGTIHYTPSSIARTVAEQALRSLEGLHRRRELVIADYACGSGAFLIESLRALERSEYCGRVTIVGRDISPAAVSMARFAVGLALSEWPGLQRCDFDVRQGNALTDSTLPQADLIVMNPPFTAWQDLDARGRDVLARILGDRQGRPDVSMAFVARALEFLAPQGVAASLLPASILEAESASRWRKQVADRGTVTFVAIIDDHSVFPQAQVRFGAFVLATGAPQADKVTMRVSRGGVDDALRALRRLTTGAGEATAGNGWSITQVRARRAQSIFGPRGATITSTKEATDAGLTTVGELFRVMQGIRTGSNPAFVLSDEELHGLPRSERQFFRKVATSKGIVDGRVTHHMFVFYPYEAGASAFKTAREVKDRLPTYFNRYLLPHRERLQSRPRVGDRWWELSERRPRLEKGGVVFVSKYFAGPGGVALDLEGASLVLQGYGWIPVGRAEGQITLGDREVPDITAAYLALLNSREFFAALSDYSPPVAGGQRDMSPRFLQSVPIPDLTQPMHHREVQILARHARSWYLGDAPARGLTTHYAEAAVSRLLDVGAAREGREARDRLPDWIDPLLEGGMDGSSGESRVELLTTMQKLAQRGDVDEIDLVLGVVDVAELAEISLITLLRGTFAFSNMLPNWEAFRERVRAEFERRGINTRKVLAGLNT
jgi:adenine-specific DNA-methyltransferase